MRKTLAIASGLVAAAALSGALADELQVSKMKYPQPVVGTVLVCAGTTAPAECDARNALDVMLGPPSATELGCGAQGQEILAGTGIRARDDQYVKIVCSRDTARAD
jgi:hypothetical protein